MNAPDQFPSAKQKSFELYAEECKQLLTLATGVVALTITFSKDFAPHNSVPLRALAVFAWAVLFVSVVVGVLRLDALAGTLDEAERPSIWGGGVELLTKAHHVLFGGGLFLIGIYGALSVFITEPSPKQVSTVAAPAVETPSVPSGSRGNPPGSPTPTDSVSKPAVTEEGPQADSGGGQIQPPPNCERSEAGEDRGDGRSP